MISAISSVVTGVVSRRLEHDRVAGGDGGRPLPDRHHHRVVPRRDLGADADRLAPDERRVVRPCTRRPTAALEHAARRRRRTGSGRPIGGISSRHGQAPRGLPVFSHFGARRARRRAPRRRRRSAAAPGCARTAWSRARSRRRRPPPAGAGRRPRRPRPARWRRPRPCWGRRRSSVPAGRASVYSPSTKLLQPSRGAARLLHGRRSLLGS